MECYVVTGDDHARVRSRVAEFTSSPDIPVERFNLADGEGPLLARSASTGSLFAPSRVLVAGNCSHLTLEDATFLTAHGNKVTVVLHGERPPRKPVLAILRDLATVETYALPKEGSFRLRVRNAAVEAGVTLSTDAEKSLTAVGPGAVARVDSALSQCAALGLFEPTVQQVETLLGSTFRVGKPWDVADLLWRGDLAGAVTQSHGLDPVPLVSYFGSVLRRALVVAEHDAFDIPSAQNVLGACSRGQASGAIRAARTLGRRNLPDAVRIAASADREIKMSMFPDDHRDLFLARLYRLVNARE